MNSIQYMTIDDVISHLGECKDVLEFIMNCTEKEIRIALICRYNQLTNSNIECDSDSY